jgi:hypothetical protein
MEVNLAVRLSSIGIPDAGLDSNAEGGPVRQTAGTTLEDNAVKQVAAK